MSVDSCFLTGYVKYICKLFLIEHKRDQGLLSFVIFGNSLLLPIIVACMKSKFSFHYPAKIKKAHYHFLYLRAKNPITINVDRVHKPFGFQCTYYDSVNTKTELHV